MKLPFHTTWFTALKAWRRQRHDRHDPAGMGTAFGLDSITVVNFESTPSTSDPTVSAPAAADWQRRVTRRSSL